MCVEGWQQKASQLHTCIERWQQNASLTKYMYRGMTIESKCNYICV